MKWKDKSARIWKPIIFILPEGKTEQQYFLWLKRKIQKRNKIFVLSEESWKIDENNLEVSYKNIEKAIKNTFRNNQLSYKDLRKDFTEVFVVLDLDVYKNKEKIKKYFASKRIKVIFLNPCFESFLLSHFDDKCFELKNCDDLIKKLRKYIKAYKKWDTKQIENILEKFENWLENLRKFKNNNDLLVFLDWLINLS